MFGERYIGDDVLPEKWDLSIFILKKNLLPSFTKYIHIEKKNVLIQFIKSIFFFLNFDLEVKFKYNFEI